jgi:sporulation protein YlmC with PRC-barrel domain
MKRVAFAAFLVLALMLAACASGGAEQTPGAIGTDNGLGTESGLGTATQSTAPTTEATVAATSAATTAATEAATAAATSAATSTVQGQATTEVETGIVAMPYSMFTVASVTGNTGTGTGDTGTGGTGTGTGTQAAGTQPAGTQAAGTGTQPATTGTQTTGDMNDNNAMLVRASELVGSQVVDMNGDTVGDVMDVLVNETGVIQYVIVDANDFLQANGTGGTGTDGTGTGGTGGTGTGTQVAGTPAPVGTLDNSTQVVGTIEPAGTAAAGTPEAIATSTVGEGTAMPGTAVVADEDTVLIFDGTAADIRDQGIMLPQALMDDDGVTFDLTGGDIAANLSQLDGLLRVSNLTDDQVVNANDDDLGQVEDWIVDLRQGMLQFGVVDFGGFLGIAENTVAVPWDQFTINASGDNNLMLDVTEDTLRNAPQLDMSDWQPWPNPLPSEWVTETQTFWETAG